MYDTSIYHFGYFRYDHIQRIEISRIQIPLALSYATTVHKSQGMSADHVEVHAEDMFFPALLAVAISRVKKPSGLYVTGFTRRSVLKPNDSLIAAINKHGIPSGMLDNCCSVILDCTDEFAFDDSDSESEGEDSITPDPDEQPSSSGNHPMLKELLLKQTYLSPVTPQQEQINKDIKQLRDSTDLNSIYHFMLDNLNAFYTDTICNKIKPDNAANGVIFSTLMSSIYGFTINKLTENLRTSNLASRYHRYIRQLMTDMTNQLFNDEASKVASKTISDLYPTPQYHISSDSGRGVVRRVGGRAVYLASKQQEQKIKTHVKNNTTHTNEYKELKRTLKWLQSLRATEEEVRKGRYVETAAETNRMQTTKALTHISDEAYEYFTILEQKRDRYHSIGEALLQGNAIVRNTYNALLLEPELEYKLKLAAPADPGMLQNLNTILIKKYLPVGNNQFRKTLVKHFEKTKRLAHRPQIAATEETTTKKRRVSF